MKILKVSRNKTRAQYCLPSSVEIELSGKIANRLILEKNNNNGFELLIVFLMVDGLISMFSLSFFRLGFSIIITSEEGDEDKESKIVIKLF